MARKLYTDRQETPAEMMAKMAEAAGPMTPDEYKARVKAAKRVSDAAEALSDDAALRDAVETVQQAAQKMTDSLAVALAGTAHAFGKVLDNRETYYIDDIWEALGKYAYHNGQGVGAEPLFGLEWSFEKCYEKYVAKQASLNAAAAAALVSEVAATSDELPVGEAMDQFERDAAKITEYEREQPPGETIPVLVTFPPAGERDPIDGKMP